MSKKMKFYDAKAKTVLGLSIQVAGGVAAGIVMVLYVVVNAALTPLPPRPAPVAAPPQQQASSAAPQPSAAPEPSATPQPAVAEVAPAPAAPIVPPEPDMGPVLARDSGTVPPLQRDVRLSRAAFEAGTNQIDIDDIFGNKSLAYRVRLPKDWVSVAEADLQKLKTNPLFSDVVASFSSPPNLGLRSRFTLRAQGVAHLITLRDWVDGYVGANQITPHAMSVVDSNRVELMYVRLEQDVPYIVRAAIVQNGPQMAIAEYTIPQDWYETESDRQTWGITSFYLKYKNVALPEAVTPVILAHRVTFALPTAWTALPPVDMGRDIAAIGFFRTDGVEDAPDFLKGRMDIVVMPDGPYALPSDVIKVFSARLSDKKLSLGGLLGHWPGDPAVRSYAVMDGAGTPSNFEFYLTRRVIGADVVYVGLLTPPRAAFQAFWAHNIAVQDFVTRGIKIPLP